MDPNDSKATRGILVEVINRPSTETGEVMVINAPDWRSILLQSTKTRVLLVNNEERLCQFCPKVR